MSENNDFDIDKVSAKPAGRGVARVWLFSDDRQLETLYALGYSPKTIAKRLNRTPKQVEKRARELGIVLEAGEVLDGAVKNAKNRTHYRRQLIAEINDELALTIQKQAMLHRVNEYPVVLKGEGGAEIVTRGNWIPPRDASDIGNAIKNLQHANKLIEDSNLLDPTENVRGLVDNINEKLDELRKIRSAEEGVIDADVVDDDSGDNTVGDDDQVSS